MTYHDLTLADDDSLHWRQPDLLTWRFLLGAVGDRIFGAVDFTPPSGTGVLAETATGRWRFEQVGSWRPQTRAYAGDDLVATLDVTNVWLGNRASLVTPTGEVIGQWVMTSYLMGTVEWQDEADGLLMAFRRGTDEGGVGSWVRTQCRVDFTPAGFAHPHRDLMLTIGWYFTVLASNPYI